MRSPGCGVSGLQKEAPKVGGRAGMAAAAAGAAQEKQFPPALLSFFIYNPRFGPREGEVRKGLRAAVTRRLRRGRGAAGRRRTWGTAGDFRAAASARQAPGSTCHSALLERPLRRLLSASWAPGPGYTTGARRRRLRLFRVQDQSLCFE